MFSPALQLNICLHAFGEKGERARLRTAETRGRRRNEHLKQEQDITKNHNNSTTNNNNNMRTQPCAPAMCPRAAKREPMIHSAALNLISYSSRKILSSSRLLRHRQFHTEIILGSFADHPRAPLPPNKQFEINHPNWRTQQACYSRGGYYSLVQATTYQPSNHIPAVELVELMKLQWRILQPTDPAT